MALNSYADLQAATAFWIGRGDLDARIPDFIMMFERMISRRLRVRQMAAVITFATIGGRAPLPSDYLMWRRMTWVGNSSVDMQYRTPSAIRIQHPIFVSGIPCVFSIEPPTILTADEDDVTVDDDDIISTFQIVTADIDDSDSAFSFEYYRKLPPLADALNWLMAEHPDLYLFGTLTEAYGAQKDAENQALWGSRRDEVIDDIMKLDTRTRGPAAIVVAGATP